MESVRCSGHTSCSTGASSCPCQGLRLGTAAFGINCSAHGSEAAAPSPPRAVTSHHTPVGSTGESQPDAPQSPGGSRAVIPVLCPRGSGGSHSWALSSRQEQSLRCLGVCCTHGLRRRSNCGLSISLLEKELVPSLSLTSAPQNPPGPTDSLKMSLDCK